AEAAAARAGMEDAAAKDRLRAETDRAIERGVFVSPFFCFDDQRLWGWDRLPMLEAWLKSGGW
ncbi:MAG TPA: DsbA family protein, partial [Azospirillaceae bacterium]|nr:DsbA family protein [Azospirillaceae bacterium]